MFRIRFAFVLAVALLATACGGGGGNPVSPSPGPGPGTPPITGATLTLSSSALSFTALGESKTLTVTVSGGDLAWELSPTPWVSYSPSSGKASAVVNVTTARNYGDPREVKATIGGQMLTISQEKGSAPPPPGVSPEVWRVAFIGDRLYRPDAVHLVLPSDISPEARANFIAVVTAMNSWGLSTPIDIVASAPATGATFVVSVVPGLICGLTPAGGCTLLGGSDPEGKIVGKGKMQFAFASAMHQFSFVMHECLRTIGVMELSPFPGILYHDPTPPTPEELVMLRARDKLPLLSIYSAQ